MSLENKSSQLQPLKPSNNGLCLFYASTPNIHSLHLRQRPHYGTAAKREKEKTIVGNMSDELLEATS